MIIASLEKLKQDDARVISMEHLTLRLVDMMLSQATSTDHSQKGSSQ